MTTTTASKTDALFATIAEQIIKTIEEGQATGTWTKPWVATSIPTNASTGKTYRGVNVLWFWMTAATNGYNSQEWATYKQWQALGAQVRKGEKGTAGVKWIVATCKDHGSDEQCNRCGRMFPSTFTVFNAEQVDGYEPKTAAVLSTEQRIANAETFFGKVGATVIHGGDSAYYRPSTDTVHLPEFSSFLTADGYYSTLAHELTHWTGPKVGRDMTGRFGDEAYAMEELVAELGAAMVCGHLQITESPRPDHAQYLASWVKVLRDDPRALNTAASKAAGAAEYLIGLANAE